MSVYVDNPRHPLTHRGRRMKMCHMVADSYEEMHDMASKLGVRRYFQDHPKHPHYDICASNREKAISLGAVPVDSKTLLVKSKALIR